MATTPLPYVRYAAHIEMNVAQIDLAIGLR